MSEPNTIGHYAERLVKAEQERDELRDTIKLERQQSHVRLVERNRAREELAEEVIAWKAKVLRAERDALQAERERDETLAELRVQETISQQMMRERDEAQAAIDRWVSFTMSSGTHRSCECHGCCSLRGESEVEDE